MTDDMTLDDVTRGLGLPGVARHYRAATISAQPDAWRALVGRNTAAELPLTDLNR